jgi:hypothetical protein
MLTLETAIQYVNAHFAQSDNGCEIRSASLADIDGIPVVKVRFVLYAESGTQGFTFDVWSETRANGDEYLYGEW